jgi:glyoxylase-like metal-dependent hydrolase (beta-lactamase superfamily II)
LIPGEVKGQSSGIYEFDAGPVYWNTKNFFYDNGEEVIVFDAQFSPEAARQSIEFIKSKTNNPITWVVILHPAVDKFNGIKAFQEIGAKVLASTNTAASMPAVYAYKRKFFLEGAGKSLGFPIENWPALEKIDSIFDGSLSLELKNGQKIILRELGKPAASSHHTIAYIAEEEALFVGDLIHYQAHVNLEGNVMGNKTIPMLASWLEALNEVNKIFRKDPEITVYGGRGKQTSIPTAVWDQTRYLKAAYPIITNFYLNNRRNWSATNIADKYYKEFQSEMERAFPGFELLDMTRTALWACWECEGVEKLK